MEKNRKNMYNKYSNITWDNILKMPSKSILEKVLEFCEEFDYDISEVLDVFDNKELRALLYTDCVEHHVIKDPELKKILDSRLEIQEEI
jgi:hypothetical protein